MLFASARRCNAWVAVLAVILSAAGCGQEESLPADKVIEKAAPAMQAVNTFHLTLATSKLRKPVPGLFITGADGDVAKPNKLAGTLDATVGGIPVQVKVVLDGQNQYWTDPVSGKWAAMPTNFDIGKFFDPSKGMSDILGSVKNPASDGKENVDGTDTYRIKGTVPASALKAFSPEVTAQGDLTTTLWIGSSDFLIRRVQLDGPLMSTEPADVSRTLSFKDYNKEMKFETPVVGK